MKNQLEYLTFLTFDSSGIEKSQGLIVWISGKRSRKTEHPSNKSETEKGSHYPTPPSSLSGIIASHHYATRKKEAYQSNTRLISKQGNKYMVIL